METAGKTAIARMAARDEWDCLIDCIRKHGTRVINLRGVLKLVRGVIDQHTHLGERWWVEWSSGTAGVKCKHEPIRLPYREIRRWAHDSLHITQQQLDAHRRKFFRTANELTQTDPDFVGRESELKKIGELLSGGNRVCLSTAALHGIGGQGKTSIARHYAVSERQRYAAIVWMDARTDVEQQLNAFAEGAGVKLEKDGPREERLADTFEQLALIFRGHILLVFDDVAANPASEKYLSRSETQIETIAGALPAHLAIRYHFLLTSRHAPKIIAIKTMSIERMTRDDAIDLFLKKASFTRESVDLAKLGVLVDEQLGGHPLTIALLASYARKRRIRNIDTLSGLMRARIVDADELNGTQLAGYERSLYATFKLSFDEASRDAQLLLLTLAMFRRGVIAVETVKSCARRMSPVTAQVRAFSDTLSASGGPAPSVRLLARLALAERVDASPRSQKSQVRHVQLHEVIYDFTQVQWVRLRDDPQWEQVLHDLELSFTRGAISYASAQIEASTIAFQDVDSLTGLLLPQVYVERGLLPSSVRITESLNFWYEHFIFQNFVYDTGLQDSLLEQMIALRSYLEESGQLTERFELILDKLIGHVYYAGSAETGALARQYFDRALVLAERLDAQNISEEGQISTARWYKVFLLDHRSNVASRSRPVESQALPIRDDPAFAADFNAVEAALPVALKNLGTAPSAEECELLLRAAHYWGHRGNQDSYVQYQKFLAGTLQGQNDPISESARDHYVRAANYRLLALKIFRAGQFDRYLGRAARRGALPFLVRWIDTVPSIKPQRRFESFTSLAQGIGDVAHQYRGLHFVFAIDSITTPDVIARAASRERSDRSLQCAQLLWRISTEVLQKEEVSLRYRLWMNSSQLIMALVDDLVANRAITPLESVLQQLRNTNTEMQRKMRGTYQRSLVEQERQLRAIWHRIAAP